MKKIILTALVAACMVVATKSEAQYARQYQWPNTVYSYGLFYVNGDAGGNLMQNTRIKNTDTSISFDPGFRADVAFGLQIAPPLAVEFETGVLWNSIHGAGGDTNLASGDQDANLYQIPFLANLVYRVPLTHGFSAYVGGGAGGVATELDLHEHGGGFFHHHNDDTDFTFAYQGMAGLKYAFLPNMEVGVGYKFLGTLDHSWFADDPALHIQTGPAFSHSILASFTARF